MYGFFVQVLSVKLAALQDAVRAPPLAPRATRHVATLTGQYSILIIFSKLGWTSFDTFRLETGITYY